MQNQASFAKPVDIVAIKDELRTFIADADTHPPAATIDPAAKLWRDYEGGFRSIKEQYEKHGKMNWNEEILVVNRAEKIRSMLPYTQPATIEGVIASLRVAKIFADDIFDCREDNRDREAEEAFEAIERCIDNAIGALTAMGAEIPK